MYLLFNALKKRFLVMSLGIVVGMLVEESQVVMLILYADTGLMKVAVR